MKRSVFITQTNCVTPLGFDIESNWKALSEGRSGIQRHENNNLLPIPFQAAIIEDTLLDAAFLKITAEKDFTRLEKMLILALAPLVTKTKITPGSVLILSTTKGNISLLKDPAIDIKEVRLSTLAQKIADFFGFQTVPIVVSNACVSGILSIAVAKRMILNGKYDNAFIVAGDEVSAFVLSGFNSFQAMSEAPCQPYDINRSGVNLGEAAAAVWMTADENEVSDNAFKVIGDGSVNDANHISGPSRTGEGLFLSIESAIKEAGIDRDTINLISAHGTATLYNDEMEAIALNRLQLEKKPVNSLKGFYGHTLGASGLLETVMTIESAGKNELIASKGFTETGVSQPINVIQKNEPATIQRFLKTASGFGGCNTAVLFEKVN